MNLLVLAGCLMVCVSPLCADAPARFQKIQNCEYVHTDWADGDSFQIRKPDGETLTVRLYGADCMEWHVKDDTDARRLRAQRRYFGITDAMPTARESIELAKGFGKQAAEKTAILIQRPFTVHTRMQKALGDGRFERFYAFIESADATEPVRSGLARAHGVVANGPDECTREEYRQALADIELQAAKRGRGIWQNTNWEKLPAERREQRREDEENGLANGKGSLAERVALFALLAELAGGVERFLLGGVEMPLATPAIVINHLRQFGWNFQADGRWFESSRPRHETCLNR